MNLSESGKARWPVVVVLLAVSGCLSSCGLLVFSGYRFIADKQASLKPAAKKAELAFNEITKEWSSAAIYRNYHPVVKKKAGMPGPETGKAFKEMFIAVTSYVEPKLQGFNASTMNGRAKTTITFRIPFMSKKGAGVCTLRMLEQDGELGMSYFHMVLNKDKK